MNNNEQFIIYSITNITNDKKFIGVTKNVKKYKGNIIKWTAELEFNEHKKNINRKTKCDLEPLLYKDMLLDGIENFTCEILHICNNEYNEIYTKYIEDLKTYENEFGYNLYKAKGIIYIITNTKNNKIYIGQTKTLKNIKGNIKIWSANNRFEEHKKNALRNSKKQQAPKLYNAIRECGIENFKVDTLMICELNDSFFYEQQFIKQYNSHDENIGYNTNIGGYVNQNLNNDKKNKNITNELRQKLSKTKSDHTNINDIKYKNKLVGYRVKIVFEGILYEKRFSDQKNSIEENFKKAQEYLEKIKNNEDISTVRSNNKSNDCPLNIFPKYRKKVHIGYEVNIKLNYKKYTKSFCSMKLKMEEKLKMALDYKSNLLNNFESFEGRVDSHKLNGEKVVFHCQSNA